ncbi:U3 snoRNP protein, partial [Coemansia furcata]
MATGGIANKHKTKAASVVKPKSKAAAAAAQAKVHDEGSDIDMGSDSDDDSQLGGGDDSQLDDDDDDDDDEEMAEPMLAGENTGGSGSSESTKTEGKKGQAGSKPTNAEMMALKETSLLMKSNLFKLQVDELLSETMVAGNSKATRGLDAALKQIRDVLTCLGDVGEMSTDAASNYVRKQSKAGGRLAMIPFPDPAPAVGMPIAFAFKAPKVVNVVGSYGLGTATRGHGGFNVDVVVQMPAELFQERDYLNFRYFYKRAFYVAVLLIGLQQSALGEVFDVEFGRLRGDARLPMVVLRAKAGVKHLGKGGWSIRILPSIAHDTLPLKRLSPERNYVRPSYISGAETAAEGDESLLPATPQYSAAILSDALVVTHMKYLFETAEMCAEFPRAAALLRVWVGQRAAAAGRQVGAQVLAGSQRLNGFVLTMVLAWLLRSAQSGGSGGPKLSGAMNAYQLFKGAVEFLAVHDFEEEPLQFGSGANMEAFSDSFGAVF